jgi:hypothetical protein
MALWARPLSTAIYNRRPVFCFGIKSPFPLPLPQRHGASGIVAVGTPDELKQRAIECGAIIVDQLDQSRFLEKATEFDQMTGALPS